MATATLGQLDARLTEIDNLLLSADLGDVQLSPRERSKLETEAEAILNVLARALGKASNLDPKEVYEQRNSVRELQYIAAVTKRHQELHPVDPEGDRIIAEAFKGLNDGTKTTEEAARMITSVVCANRVVQSTPNPSWLSRWVKAAKRILIR